MPSEPAHSSSAKDLLDSLIADRMTVSYKMFLEEYAAIEGFDDKKINYEQKPENLADSRLYDILKLQATDRRAYKALYGKTEDEWKKSYKKDTLYASQIIGQLAKLAEQFEIAESEIKSFELFELGKKKKKHRIVEIDRAGSSKISTLLQRIICEPGEDKSSCDNRVDFYEVEQMLKKYFGTRMDSANKFKSIKRNWNTTVIIVFEEALQPMPEQPDDMVLVTDSLKNITIEFGKGCYPLCETERFLNQRTALIPKKRKQALGTGFFLKEDVIASNGHVMNKGFSIEEIEALRFVSGFEYSPDRNYTIVNKNQIYKVDMQRFHNEFDIRCWSIYIKTDVDPDWAVVPVLKAFKTTAPEKPVAVKISNKKVYEGLELYSVGHPLGLPKKFIYYGKVYKKGLIGTHTFNCSLDMIKGNSGSPVFDASSHDLVGFLSGGDGAKSGGEFEMDEKFGCLKINNDELSNDDYQGHIIQLIDATICEQWPNLCK